ncbi:hypothetical protein GCM10027535_41630 [Mycolicibacterium hippocampi]|uniref:Uncharacterized protein n=1 Tax=Mycolicibacterium hippocampi TaxID=659824 RepID=A0A7I9ZP90_9MYCO|nr:hypothetical protein MHIP_29590 [Mycolicibacterium hippocampi]
MSATNHAWAGPSGIGIEPAGWMTPVAGTAAAVGAKGPNVPATKPTVTARDARSLVMSGEPNPGR